MKTKHRRKFFFRTPLEVSLTVGSINVDCWQYHYWLLAVSSFKIREYRLTVFFLVSKFAREMSARTCGCIMWVYLLMWVYYLQIELHCINFFSCEKLIKHFFTKLLFLILFTCVCSPVCEVFSSLRLFLSDLIKINYFLRLRQIENMTEKNSKTNGFHKFYRQITVGLWLYGDFISTQLRAR